MSDESEHWLVRVISALVISFETPHYSEDSRQSSVIRCRFGLFGPLLTTDH